MKCVRKRRIRSRLCAIQIGGRGSSSHYTISTSWHSARAPTSILFARTTPQSGRGPSTRASSSGCPGIIAPSSEILVKFPAH